MFNILKTLVERESSDRDELQLQIKTIDQVVKTITHGCPVEEMRNSRGAGWKSTGQYQLRVKPLDTAPDTAQDLIASLTKVLHSEQSAAIGISNIKFNRNSPNSSKFSSISFDYGKLPVDLVIARGANRGERFEKDLLLQLDALVTGGTSSEEAQAAIDALNKIDPSIALDKITRVTARNGSTNRTGLAPEEMGAVIADIIITLDNGDKKYISIKNKEGGLTGNFGIGGAISADLTVDKNSKAWHSWFAPFDIDADRVEQGLQAYKNETDVDWPDIEARSTAVLPDSAAEQAIVNMWGYNYFYLRQKAKGFSAVFVDKKFLEQTVLKNLKITEVRYPCCSRKQITIYLQSDQMRFKLQARNVKQGIIPTIMQLSIMGGPQLSS